MSSVPPTPLPYEPNRDADESVWRGLRLMTIVWSVAYVLRHAIYWTAVVSNAQRFLPASAVAGMEVVLLLAIAAVALAMRRQSARASAALAWLGGAMLALAVLGVITDVIRFPISSMLNLAFGVRVVWTALTRLVSLAPAVAWIALAASRAR